jgi:hypothetical protein
MSKSVGLLNWLRNLGAKSSGEKRLRGTRAVLLEKLEGRALMTATIFSGDPEYTEGAAILELNAFATTNNGPIVSIEYSLDSDFTNGDDILVDGPALMVDGDTATAPATFAANVLDDFTSLNGPGSFSLYIRVIDGDGETDEIVDVPIEALLPEIDPDSVVATTDDCGGDFVDIQFMLLGEPTDFNTPVFVEGAYELNNDGNDIDFDASVEPVPGNPGYYHFVIDGLVPGAYELDFFIVDGDGDLAEGGDDFLFTITEGGGAGAVVTVESAGGSEGGDATLDLHVGGDSEPITWQLYNGPLENLVFVELASNTTAADLLLSVTWAQLQSLGITDSGSYSLTLVATTCGCGCGDPEPVEVSLTIDNLPPVVEAIDGPEAGVRLQTLEYSTSFTDLPVDTHTTTWQVLNSADVVIASGEGLDFEFTPEASGEYTVKFTVTDDEDAASTVSQTVTITESLVEGDTLYVGGTTGTDSFTITNGLGGELLINGSPVSGSAGVATIEIILGDGNDVLFVPNSVTVGIVAFGGGGSDVMTAGGGTSVLNGGAGNDILLGGSGASVLAGGDGNDVITGGADRDVLIGGAGADLIMGGGGQDLLVDSSTIHDEDVAALNALLAEWTSSTSLASRISRISAGTDGVPRIHSSTTTNDLAIDILMGGGGSDWIAFHSGDLRLGSDQSLSL